MNALSTTATCAASSSSDNNISRNKHSLSPEIYLQLQLAAPRGKLQDLHRVPALDISHRSGGGASSPHENCTVHVRVVHCRAPPSNHQVEEDEAKSAQPQKPINRVFGRHDYLFEENKDTSSRQKIKSFQYEIDSKVEHHALSNGKSSAPKEKKMENASLNSPAVSNKKVVPPLSFHCNRSQRDGDATTRTEPLQSASPPSRGPQYYQQSLSAGEEQADNSSLDTNKTGTNRTSPLRTTLHQRHRHQRHRHHRAHQRTQRPRRRPRSLSPSHNSRKSVNLGHQQRRGCRQRVELSNSGDHGGHHQRHRSRSAPRKRDELHSRSPSTNKESGRRTTRAHSKCDDDRCLREEHSSRGGHISLGGRRPLSHATSFHHDRCLQKASNKQHRKGSHSTNSSTEEQRAMDDMDLTSSEFKLTNNIKQELASLRAQVHARGIKEDGLMHEVTALRQALAEKRQAHRSLATATTTTTTAAIMGMSKFLTQRSRKHHHHGDSTNKQQTCLAA